MILVLGEALIDMTRQAGADRGYVAHPGGGPCNTAVGLGRLGVPVAYLGGLGMDGFARLLRRHLETAGVDVSLAPIKEAPTTLAIASVDDDGKAEYSFYLDGTSAAGLCEEDVPDAIDAAVSTVYCGTLGLVLEPTATTTARLVSREAARRVVVVDPNVRPAVIRDLGTYRHRLTAIFEAADIVKLSDDDAAALDPGEDPDTVARRIQELGPPLVVLTRGAAGARAFARGTSLDLPSRGVAVVDTIGAGDSYSAGLLAYLHDHDLLTKERIRGLTEGEVAGALGFAADVAAVTVARAGADTPYRSELPASGGDHGSTTDDRP